MPKKDRKRGRKATSFPTAAVNEEDETSSVVSDVTDSTCQNSDDESNTLEEDNNDYENKVREAMDLATEKSVQTRTNALISLKIAFQKRILTSFLLENHHTISDLVERSLKKGRGLEQVAAAKLASVVVVTLLGTDEAEMVFKVLFPALVCLVQDPAASAGARQEGSSALALVTFLVTSADPAALNVLHDVFCAALPKGNGDLPSHTPATVSLHAAALHGLALLLTLMPRSTLYTMAPKLLEEFLPVLEVGDLSLRVAVGEVMALVYEGAREHAIDFRWRRHSNLLDKLDDFVNESSKHKAKKERKAQRCSFRRVLHSVRAYNDDESDPFCETVSVGPASHHTELALSSWALRFQYNALCHALEQGIHAHMTYNASVRELFSLGPPPDPDLLNKVSVRGPKRPNRQTPEVKARSLARSKNRDNRAAALDYYDC